MPWQRVSAQNDVFLQPLPPFPPASPCLSSPGDRCSPVRRGMIRRHHERRRAAFRAGPSLVLPAPLGSGPAILPLSPVSNVQLEHVLPWLADSHELKCVRGIVRESIFREHRGGIGGRGPNAGFPRHGALDRSLEEKSGRHQGRNGDPASPGDARELNRRFRTSDHSFFLPGHGEDE